MDACMPFLRTLFPFLFKKQGGSGQAEGGDAAGGGGFLANLEHKAEEFARKELAQVEQLAEQKVHQMEGVINDDLAKLQQKVGSDNSFLGKLEQSALNMASAEVKQVEATVDQDMAKFRPK